MSGKDLLEGMSYVDERFVDEAENKTIPKRTAAHWLKLASLAACLCLIVLSVRNLHQYINPGSTEGLTGENAADQAWPGEGIEAAIQQESAVEAPEDRPTAEVPSVILRVDEMTELGFTGIVSELVDTDIFEIGMELNVVIADGTRNETADRSPAMSEEWKQDLSGTYVMAQIIEYDMETGTIVIDILREAEPPEDTH